MILPNEVWTVHQVLVVTFASVGTLVLTLENSIATTQGTLWNSQAMPYFRETSISFFWVCGYNKLNKFNEGDLVFADAVTSLQNTNLSYPSLSLHVMIMSWHWAQHTPTTAYTEYSIHRVKHIPSTAYTKYSIHWVPKIVCLPFILMITSWPLNVASASVVPPYTIDHHQPALHEGSKVKSLVPFPQLRVN